MSMTNEEQMRLNDLAHQRIEETLSRVDKRVERVDLTINGNGQLGMKTTVDRHSQTLSVIKKVFWIILTGAVTVAGGAVLAMIL